MRDCNAQTARPGSGRPRRASGLGRLIIVGAAAAASLASAALAGETIVYSYDERGRLKKAVRTGTVNNNVSTEYSHDRADNRTKKETKTGQ